MEALKIIGIVYMAGFLINYYLMSFKKAVIWPMIILGFTLQLTASLLGALRDVLTVVSTILSIYAIKMLKTAFNEEINEAIARNTTSN